MPAEDVAKSLAARFLAEGNYGVEPISLRVQPATAVPLDQYFETDAGFAGLAVESVGYTLGADDEKVVIHVTRGSKKAFRALPDRIEDVEIEIDLVGKFRAAPAQSGASNLYERGQRIACGSSCAPSTEKYAGTFGALVTDGHNLLALSNNHVFAACNHTTMGMHILSPSTSDARATRRPPTEIGRHHQIVELHSGDPGFVPPNVLDVATAIVTNANSLTSWQGDVVDGFDTPNGIVEPVAGMRVKKFGRTTGLTIGVMYDYVPTPWQIEYKSNHFTGLAWFTDTWTIRPADPQEPFALPGDSGSLIVTEDATAAIGLLFAANNRGDRARIMPISDVLAGLGNLQLVSGHGI
jgi:hypothetical protein